MGVVQSIWWFLVLIGVMILIHELGHFWAARFFDVKVDAFSFGFGPRLFGFRRGETDFRFSAIPFGGYVKMAGEQVGDEHSDDPRSFLNKPRWQRLIVAFAGPLMNILLAIALVTGLFMFRFEKMPLPHSPIVGHVAPGSVAAKAGIKEGDQVVRIDDINDPTWEDIALKELASASKEVSIIVKRDGKEIRFNVIPALDEKQGRGIIGWGPQNDVMIANVEPGMDAARAGLAHGDTLISVDGIPIRSLAKLHEVIHASEGKPVDIVYRRAGQDHHVTVTPAFKNLDGQSRWMIGVHLEPLVVMTALPPGEAFREALRFNRQNAGLIFQFLRGIVERRVSPKTLEGPIRITQLSGEAAREGPVSFIRLMAAVSLNLAIFNLLPIPILDGGVILLLLVEMVMRRDLSMNIKEAVFKLGFVFLMMIVVFVLYNDISKILPG